jgi:hypothetical protein
LTLINLSAGAVAKYIRNNEGVNQAIIDELEIPFTPKKPLVDKLKDLLWTELSPFRHICQLAGCTIIHPKIRM